MDSIPTRWWRETTRNQERGALCCLCPHRCFLPDGATGRCGARSYSREQGLVCPSLGNFFLQTTDPIARKRLSHWRPGSYIYSLGSLYCTMHCEFCQNHVITRPRVELPLHPLSPLQLRQKILELELDAAIFTYGEPLLQAEYILESAPVLRQAGIGLAIKTNGMFSPEALEAVLPEIDAASVDIKSFNALSYAGMGGSLEAVKQCVETMSAKGIHLELTFLVVPGVSDAPEEFAAFIAWVAGLNPEIPLYISRCYPTCNFPATPTPLPLLHQFRRVALSCLSHVHIVNVREKRRP